MGIDVSSWMLERVLPNQGEKERDGEKKGNKRPSLKKPRIRETSKNVTPRS